MSTITQRRLPVDITVVPGADTVLWGDGEDAVLNGGSHVVAEITNNDVSDLIVTIWVKTTIDSNFVPDATTVTCPTGNSRIDLTGVSGYAVRLTADWSGVPVDTTVTASVQVQA